MRSRQIRYRELAEVEELLRLAAEKAGQSISDFCRQAARERACRGLGLKASTLPRVAGPGRPWPPRASR